MKNKIKRIDPVLSARLMKLALKNQDFPNAQMTDAKAEMEFDLLLRQALSQGLKLPKTADFLMQEEDCPHCRGLFKQEVVHALGGPTPQAGHIVMPRFEFDFPAFH